MLIHIPTSFNPYVKGDANVLRRGPLCQTSQFHAGLSSIPSSVVPRGAQKQATASSSTSKLNPNNQKGLKYFQVNSETQDNPRESKTLFNDFLLVSNTSLTSIDDLLLAGDAAGNCENSR